MNNYYVIEIQTNADGTSGVLPYGFATSDEAESKYLAVRNAALQSSVLIHTVLWIDNKVCPVLSIHSTGWVSTEDWRAAFRTARYLLSASSAVAKPKGRTPEVPSAFVWISIT